MYGFKPASILTFLTAVFFCCRGENYQSLPNFIPHKNNLREFSYIVEEVAPYRSIAALIRPELFQSLPYGNATEECWDDWQIILKYKQFQVFKFWDSYATIGTGIIEGNFLFIGQPEECVNTKKDPGKISYADFPDTKPFLVGLNVVLNITGESVIAVPLTTGVCMPRSCNQNDVKSIVKMAIENEKMETPPEVTYAQERTEFEVDTAFVFAVIVFGTLAILVVMATTIGVYDTLSERYIKLERKISQKYSALSNEAEAESDGMVAEGSKGQVQGNDGARKRYKQMYMKLLMCFDFTANFAKIMEVPKTTQQNTSSLAALNGVRVISMGWVILGHTLLHSIYFQIFDNDIYILYSRSSNFLFQVAGNCSLSVDSFFVLSGFLLMVGTLKALEKVNDPYSVKFWLMFYVHRVVRLWPVLLLTLLFIKGLYPTLAGLFYSPMFQVDKKDSIVKLCEGTEWLQTAFFYNNWIVAHNGKCCMAWTWYLSNDIQFYIISPLFVLLVKKNRVWGSYAIGTATLLSTITLFCINVIHKLPLFAAPGLAASDRSFTEPAWGDRSYRSFYCRFQTYGIGLLFGVIAYEQESIRAKMHHHFQLNFRILIMGSLWLLSFVLGSLALFGAYPSLNGHMMSQGAVDVFNSTYRIVWSLAIGILIILCSWGYGGIINSMLSSNLWVPLARIGYTVYIIHVVCLMTWVDSTEKTTRFNTLNVSVLFSGFFVCIYCVAMIVSCIIEAPFINLEKLLLRPNPK